MTRPSKKDEERGCLLRLLSSVGIPGEILDGDFEKPDLVMMLANRRIGVEVTTMHHDQGERQGHGIKLAIVREAERSHEALIGDPVGVTIYFRPNKELPAANRKHIGELIARFVGRNLPDAPYTSAVRESHELPEELGKFIAHMRFWRQQASGNWQTPRSSWVAPLTPTLLREAILRKEEKLQIYRQKGYDEYWLLIVSLNGPGSTFEPQRGVDYQAVESRFDRTFYDDGFRSIDLGRAANGRLILRQ